MAVANAGTHVAWGTQNVFVVLETLKSLANFLQLFCQFYAIPQRGLLGEFVTHLYVQIPVGRRWA
eukprot:5279036-Alexandrium_andersonii.AAC.1